MHRGEGNTLRPCYRTARAPKRAKSYDAGEGRERDEMLVHKRTHPRLTDWDCIFMIRLIGRSRRSTDDCSILSLKQITAGFEDGNGH